MKIHIFNDRQTKKEQERYERKTTEMRYGRQAEKRNERCVRKEMK